MTTQATPQYRWGEGEVSDVRHSSVPTNNEDEMVSEDVRHGLPVIIYARWLLIIAGFGLALWNPDGLVTLEVTVVLILGMAVGNFFLHVETARNKPIKKVIVYAASVADIIAVTVVLAMAGSYPSSIYVFYMPALLALSVTFQTRDTFFFSALAIAAYGLVSVVQISDLEVISNIPTTVLAHVLTLAAIPLCGNVYWRLEAERRTREAQIEQLERQVSNQFESLESHSADVKAG